MNLCFDRIHDTVAYLERRLDVVFNPPYTVIGIEKNGQIVGGWLFNDYNGHNVEINVALDVPLLPGMIRAVKHYLFNQLRVRRVTGRCRESNVKSARMMSRLGFTWDGRQPFYYGDEAAVLYGCTR